MLKPITLNQKKHLKIINTNCWRNKHFSSCLWLLRFVVEIEKESKSQRPSRAARAEPEHLLRQGNRKRLRCVTIQDDTGASSPGARADGQRRATSRVNRHVIRGALVGDSNKENNSKEFPASPLLPSPLLHNRWNVRFWCCFA